MDLIRQLDEKRAAEREEMLRWGEILFTDGETGIECVILNMSDTGALLQIEATAALPKEFSLIPDEQPRLPSRVIWRIANRVGVEFIQQFSDSPSSGDWIFPVGDPRRPKEVRSHVLRHPIVVS